MPSGTSRSMPSRTTWVPYDFRRPDRVDRGPRRRGGHAAPPGRAARPRIRCRGLRLPAAGRRWRRCRRAAAGSARGALERLDDLEGRLGGRGPVADVPEAEVGTPAGRLALAVDHRVVRAALDVEDELAGPATVDAEGLDAAVRRVDPLAQKDADEPDLTAATRPDADDELVEAFLSSLLHVDIAAERGSDRRREVVAGKFLCALVDGEVPIGDVDRLVRHPSIVTPVGRYNHT